MRRTRSIKERREQLLKQRKKVRQRDKTIVAKPDPPKSAAVNVSRTKLRITKTKFVKSSINSVKTFSQNALNLGAFVPTPIYKYTGTKQLTVCHVIESLGLGGGQVMMMELVNGMNKYYPDASRNLFVVINKQGRTQSFSKLLYHSYGIYPQQCDKTTLTKFCEENKVDIVFHHRISCSLCVKHLLPASVKYVLINHTWNRMDLIRDFKSCDVYISVCKFLDQRANFSQYLHPSRHFAILNGIENDLNIPTIEMEGNFKVGRCHKMTPGKFQTDSVPFLTREMSKIILGFHYHHIGTSKEAKEHENHPAMTYYGSVVDRLRKFSIIKGLDVYFYETASPEGASIAILESLSMGVPVLCRNVGGCPELVKNGVNGFILSGRDEFKYKMFELYSNKDNLNDLKQKTLNDFKSRLHIKHTACKYVQVIEALSHE